MPKIPRSRFDVVPVLAKVAQVFGGDLRYSSEHRGTYVRIGTPPYHVDIQKGDSIVKKGGMAIVTKFYVQQKLAYLRKHPELKGLVNDTEKLLKAQVKLK